MLPHDTYADIAISSANRVAVVEIRRPPNNFFDRVLIQQLREAFDIFDRDDECRSLVLCAEGKNFCSGADFSKDGRAQESAPIRQQTAGSTNLYKEAVRLFRFSKPVIAAIQGAAVGGGLGLAMVADFRVTCRLIGAQQAEMMFYTGDRIPGDKAVQMGLASLLVPLAEVRRAAMDLATRIAQSAPLAIRATRATMRRGLADAVEAATDHEFVEQEWLFRTRDFREGVRAMAAREIPDFEGH
jgi:enoyl-CoA hydratase/carnithine racemase